VHTRDTIYVDGAFIPSTGSSTLPVTNPVHRAGHRHVPEGTVEDVDKAVRAAAAAFPAWAATSRADR
jgi:aldehyde dehydrogenase (NAD+)